MKLIILLFLLLSSCATTRTAIIFCKDDVKKCMEDQVGDVKIIRIDKISLSTYMVDYEK